MPIVNKNANYSRFLNFNNMKTAMCHYTAEQCPYGIGCKFAHSCDELVKVNRRKIHLPCWYFNNVGCTKTSKECMYDHVYDKHSRKPLKIQRPCSFYHHRTPLKCIEGDKCSLDHDYELTEKEWLHHFPNVTYPGKGYFDRITAYKSICKEWSEPLQMRLAIKHDPLDMATLQKHISQRFGCSPDDTNIHKLLQTAIQGLLR